MRRYGESKIHEKEKERIAAIIREYGWEAYTEYPFECQTEKGPSPRCYWADIYAQNYSQILGGNSRSNKEYDVGLQSSGKRIIVEIQGPGSHHSKLARGLDNGKRRDIRASHGSNIQFKEVYINKKRRGGKRSTMDVRTWERLDIAEHLGL